MNTSKTFFSCVFALSVVVLSAAPNTIQAQDFSLSSLGRPKPLLSMLDDNESTAASNVDVSRLPNDFFGPNVEVDATSEQVAAAYASANLWVLAALAGLFGVGTTITGLCILKRKPKLVRVRVVARA